ncbi:DNA-binding transcriptional regulator, Lrp family [Ruminococcus sp. YE71]|uniref:Lrp/AsnC family transcriptional regulator n=1 Tax=unclassified Ruminococcus TaxID=2608920 RepID=UPI000889550A|nr:MULTISPECIES: Lrp/AsnC family transcriptional regulator [unclassified Ruminococcus]SDA29366.1 DNA-binding transcriptional regulator, Lrp family [Ruminococcus sp. YE78]SFW48136.1 DNA-binding transcriptional regulator, Lrp family [Ruminococcus sp. YE71]
MDTLLRLLKQNARLTNAELAVMLGISEAEVAEKMAEYERQGIIKGYTAIIDDSAADPNTVTAFIELKVTPQSRSGFDEIAQEIAGYEQVESVMLMSGSYDVLVTVTGSNIREVSLFVSERLAAIDAVTATATHFRLKAYKQNGVLISAEERDERGMVL